MNSRNIRMRLAKVEAKQAIVGRIVYAKSGETDEDAVARSLRAEPNYFGGPVRCRRLEDFVAIWEKDRAAMDRESALLGVPDLDCLIADISAAIEVVEANRELDASCSIPG